MCISQNFDWFGWTNWLANCVDEAWGKGERKCKSATTTRVRHLGYQTS